MNRPTIFNLIYHCAPFRVNNRWRENLEWLLRYQSLFNGKRVVGVVTGSEFHEAETVMAEFPPGWARFVVLPNNPNIREGVTFPELLRAVADPDPNQATFRAHTKGVTDARREDLSGRWRNTMYWMNLAEHTRAWDALETYAIVGSHRVRTPVQPAGHVDRIWGESHRSDYDCMWYFAGAFYWFRNDAVFGNDLWQTLPVHPHMPEALPGLLFHYDRGYCLWGDNWNGRVEEPTTFGMIYGGHD